MSLFDKLRVTGLNKRGGTKRELSGLALPGHKLAQKV